MVTFSIIEGTVKKVQTYNGVLEFIVADKKQIPSNFSVQEQKVFLKYEDAMKELKKKTPPTNKPTVKAIVKAMIETLHIYAEAYPDNVSVEQVKENKTDTNAIQ